MRFPKLRLAALALTSGLVLGGCAYGFGDPYGSYGGIGVGYGNYGYGSPYGGYGYGSPYGGYGYGYPGGYGYGYGNPYGGYGDYLGYGSGGYPYGWYNGYYYPGSGYYVYDRTHHRRQITDAERQYWRDKFSRYRTGSTSGTVTTSSIAPRENWSGFKRVRTRTVDTTNSSSSSRGSERSRWNRPSSSQSSSSSSSSTSSSDSHSSDFMRRHSPRRAKD
ncbi:MAG TPA: hypothetical protein VIZ66_01100 [Sphingomicrobium sp.]